MFHNFLTAILERPFFEINQRLSRPGIEVPLRHVGIRLPLSPQESLNIPSVLFLQGLRAILGITLKVYKQTLPFIFYEDVDARPLRFCEHGIAAGVQLIGPHFVPTRMWESDRTSELCGECMLEDFFRVEHTKALVVQAMPRNSVAVEDAGMRRQTGQNCGSCIAFGPIHDLGQLGPVWFLPQVGLTRFSAGDDSGINVIIPEIVEARIEALQMGLHTVGSRNRGQGTELDEYRKVA